MKHSQQRYLLRIVTIGIVVVIWSICSRLLPATLHNVVPSPVSTVRSLWSMIMDGVLWDIGYSTIRVVIAIVLSFACAVPLAIAMYWNTTIRLCIAPLVDFVRYIPVPAMVPLVLIAFGIGDTAKIVTLFLGISCEVIVAVYGNLQAIKKEYYEMAFIYNYGFVARITMQLRAIGPELWDVLRISIGWCWSYIIIAELVATDRGIGYIVKEAQRFSDSSKLFAAVIMLGLLGLITDRIMKYGYRKLFPYRKRNYDFITAH